ncbi:MULTISPECIES: DICT sensory domain-containing protein [unclassified Haladaptatus]|uniref:DICT sensory domain-containing protein n=1 Tax=unclassified Haladaptatus TaxID=2622732 RepID=UPI0023E86219|nr:MULTISPECIES: DICT sensory domain-containing protein [unclassified Haladaptatus]
MSLVEIIAGVEAHEKLLTVFNPQADQSLVPQLRDALKDRNVRVELETTKDGAPYDFAVLSRDGEFETAFPLSTLEAITNPTPGDDDLGWNDEAYRPILQHLDETMFTSRSIKEMVQASREIEDRAWRLGRGRLHAGFQYLSTLSGELHVYEKLGTKDIEVHAYATPDTDVPDHEGFILHLERASEIEKTWFVIFDGAGNDIDKCALLAEERAPREFYGFWTYDPKTVDWILDYLDETYGIVELS